MVDPIVSEYFRQLVKKRTDNHRGFNNVETAKRAGEAGRATQKANREKKKISETGTEE
jgi:hypothetical protein